MGTAGDGEGLSRRNGVSIPARPPPLPAQMHAPLGMQPTGQMQWCFVDWLAQLHPRTPGPPSLVVRRSAIGSACSDPHPTCFVFPKQGRRGGGRFFQHFAAPQPRPTSTTSTLATAHHLPVSLVCSPSPPPKHLPTRITESPTAQRAEPPAGPPPISIHTSTTAAMCAVISLA